MKKAEDSDNVFCHGHVERKAWCFYRAVAAGRLVQERGSTFHWCIDCLLEPEDVEAQDRSSEFWGN